MAQPKVYSYDVEDRLVPEADDNTRFFAFVNSRWVVVWDYRVLTPPPIKRTKIDWEE